MRPGFAFGIFLLGAIGSFLRANARQARDSADKTRLPDVVVTGQYGSSTATQAVQKIRVIGRAQIEAMAAQNLRDVLTNEAGVRLSQDNILGSSLSVQGISGQNIKYLLDGVPMIGRQNGDVDLSQINLNNIERIEIIRGPMSVNYGNNALGGTINLITRKGSPKRVEASATGYSESIGTYNTTARIGANFGSHQLSLSGGRNFFDGWNSGDPVSPDFAPRIADSSRFKSWKPREQYFGDLQYIFRSGTTSYTIKSAIFDETIVNRGLPRPPYGEAATDDRYLSRRLDEAIFIQSKAIRGHNLGFQAAYNHYRRIKNTYATDLTTLDQVLAANPGDQDTSIFKLIHSRASISRADSGTLGYELGWDINHESGRGLRILDGSQSIGDYAVFASAEYRGIRGLTLRPGLRYAHNTRYPSPVTPAINVRYAYKSWIFRGSYARGFRAPDLKELFFFFVDINHDIRGNAALKPEQSDNYNVSADYGFRAGEVRFKLEGMAFYNDIRDRINLAMISTASYSYINIGRYKTLGGSLNGGIAWKQLNASAGLIYTGFYNDLSGNVPDAPVFSYSPEFRASINYAFGKSGFSAALFYKYTGAMPGFALNDADLVETRIQSYSIADLTLMKRFGTGLQLTGGVKNIFDVTSLNAVARLAGQPVSSTFQPLGTGRMYFLGATIKLER